MGVTDVSSKQNTFESKDQYFGIQVVSLLYLPLHYILVRSVAKPAGFLKWSEEQVVLPFSDFCVTLRSQRG